MTDTSEPRTEAGRAHRRYLHAIVHGPNPDGSFDCRNGCECSDDILAIEAEAAATRPAALDVEAARLLRSLADAADAYSPREEHDWRCEVRTAEAGWKEGEPPVIRCECGRVEMDAALEAAYSYFGAPARLASEVE